MEPSDDQLAGRAMGSRFRTTRWGVVLTARGDSPEAGEALAILCETYWYPLYAFARRKGLGPEAAADLVQGFLARLLEKRALNAVDQRNGRFRSFLMAACSHYLSNGRDHDRALKRGGGRPNISINRVEGEDRYGREPSHTLTPERLYERQWALTLLNRVLGRLEEEMAAANRSRQFEALRPALLGAADRAPFAEIAAILGVSADAARASASRLRRRYRELLREEVAGTLADPDDLDDEIRALFAALSA